MALDINTKTRVFLDRKAVADAVGKAAAAAMYKAGYILRRSARQSMRRRKAASAPGTPPSAHSGKGYPRGPLLKKFLFSEFDLTTKSMVVGPTRLGNSDAPLLQEKGGTIRIKVIPPRKTGRKASPAQATAFKRKIKDGSIVRMKAAVQEKSITLPARPYMRPALTREMPKFPSLYANTVKP